MGIELVRYRKSVSWPPRLSRCWSSDRRLPVQPVSTIIYLQTKYFPSLPLGLNILCCWCCLMLLDALLSLSNLSAAVCSWPRCCPRLSLASRAPALLSPPVLAAGCFTSFVFFATISSGLDYLCSMMIYRTEFQPIPRQCEAVSCTWHGHQPHFEAIIICKVWHCRKLNQFSPNPPLWPAA